jgi:hypothetical protein
VTEHPAGWKEPVNDALLSPPTFFGAGPRWLAIALHVAGFGAAMFSAVHGDLVWMVLPVVLSSVGHVVLAGLTHVEPYWWPMVMEWLQAPRGRVDP